MIKVDSREKREGEDNKRKVARREVERSDAPVKVIRTEKKRKGSEIMINKKKCNLTTELQYH